MFLRSNHRTSAGALLLGLVVLSAGCGGVDLRARATVKGKVSLGSKHLTIGTVRFTSVKMATYMASARIDKNGNYTMTDAPLGEVQVTVDVPPPPPGGFARMKGGPTFAKDAKGKDGVSVNPDDPSKRIAIMGDMPEYVVSIPDRYSKPETSGLTYTVQRGEQTYDIPLKP